MRIIIIYQQYLDDVNGTVIIGGLQAYIERLCDFALAEGHEILMIQMASAPFERDMDPDGRFHLVGVPKKRRDRIADLLAEAEKRGDREKDLLLFATSTLIRKHGFRRSTAIQHGIYWDIPTVHGKRPPFPMDMALRFVQANQLIRQHRKVSQMICVDYNYVNWLRAVTTCRSLSYKVIPNFSDIPHLAGKEPRDSVRLIYARRFEEIRGVRLIQDFLPKLLRRYQQLSVTIAGDGSYLEELHKTFDSFENVSFVRYAPKDSLAIHQGHDIAIVPTIGSEGTSLSLLEAMAAGCAVVCSDVGGMSNIILDGYNGRIVPPDSAAFERAIQALIENPDERRTLAERGRETTAEAFSLERWQRQWREVLNGFDAGNEG